MKIREVIEMLLHNNTLEDEVIFSFWDKNYFIDSTDLTPEQIGKVWAEFTEQGQQTLEGNLDFTNTGIELIEELEEMLEEEGF